MGLADGVTIHGLGGLRPIAWRRRGGIVNRPAVSPGRVAVGGTTAERWSAPGRAAHCTGRRPRPAFLRQDHTNSKQRKSGMPWPQVLDLYE